ncbi:hypothetical protein NKH34_30670 [Mesorhizobium sp. M1148]|uniref:hypothetical protein n=1 Tax=unclassified Mesorhizobium TaxID=325217 RepID=UPI003338140E
MSSPKFQFTLLCISLIGIPTTLYADEIGQFVVPWNKGERLTNRDALVLKKQFGPGVTDSVGQELGGSDGILILPGGSAQFPRELNGVDPGTLQADQSGLSACLLSKTSTFPIADKVAICNSADASLNFLVSVDGTDTLLAISSEEVKVVDVTGADSIVGKVATSGVDNSFELKAGQFYILQGQGGKWVLAN